MKINFQNEPLRYRINFPFQRRDINKEKGTISFKSDSKLSCTLFSIFFIISGFLINHYFFNISCCKIKLIVFGNIFTFIHIALFIFFLQLIITESNSILFRENLVPII